MNPPKFLAAACAVIRDIELDEMLRTLELSQSTGRAFPPAGCFFRQCIETFISRSSRLPHRGVYDGVGYEQRVGALVHFKAAEMDNEVVCFLKLPRSAIKHPCPHRTSTTSPTSGWSSNAAILPLVRR